MLINLAISVSIGLVLFVAIIHFFDLGFHLS